MKKWLAILCVLFLVSISVIPAVPAAAQTPTPTGTPTTTSPMTVTVGIPPPAQYQTTDVQSGDVKCTTIEGGYYDITSANIYVTFTTQSFTCLGQVVMGIGTYYGGTHWSGGFVQASVSDTDTFYYDADFQSDGATPLDGGTIGQGESTSITLGGGAKNGTDGPNAVVTNYFYVHASTKPACDQGLQKGNIVGSGTIAATNEAGVLEPLTANHQYELTISGGPWNNGGTPPDRYDTAMKLSDAGNESSYTWMTLAYFSQNDLAFNCIQVDPADATKTEIVFTARETDPAYTTVDFRIRVNDLPGQFADNTGGMNFELAELYTASYGCQNQYLQGSQIEGGTIDATLSAGVYNHIHPSDNSDAWVAGNWIEIITSGGPWQDGGTPPDRYDVAIQNPDGSWSELTGSSNSACSTTNGNYVTAYYQLPTSNGIYLRVNDTGGVWNNNTGSMNYQIYSTTYSPYSAAGCAETYQLGKLLKTVDAPAGYQGGVSVGSLGANDTDVTGSSGGESDLRYYAIETSGIWYNGSTPETWGGIASNDSTTTAPDSSAWSNLQTAPGVVCAVPLDPIGHIRIYLPLSLIHNYWLRAQPAGMVANWAGNSGNLTFNIYEVSQMQTPGYTPGTMPNATVCDSSYSKGAAGPSATIYGSNSSGIYLNALGTSWVPGHIYAIETTSGPWSNNGTSSYEVAISTDNGASWTNLVAFPSALCAESSDGNHLLVFFMAQSGRVYKVRVYDPGGNYSDNTGSIGVTLYGAVTTTINPWGSCSGNYILSQIPVANNVIPTTGISIINGLVGPPVTISNIQAGGTYAIEISNGAWFYPPLDPTTHYYASEISQDNGSNWGNFGPSLSWPTCVVQLNQSTIPAQSVYRVYFTAGTGTYQMRTSAIDIDAAVTGNLNYVLYSTTPSATQSPYNNTYAGTVIPPAWELACYESLLRPSGFFEDTNFQIPSISFGTLGSITFPNLVVPIPNIDQWISYLEASVRSLVSWCPEDTAALSAIPTALNQYEPFGTISDVVSIIHTIQGNVSAMQTSGGDSQNFAPYSIIFGTGGGNNSGSSFQGILPVLGADSPWMGGQLKWGVDGSSASGGESTSSGPFSGQGQLSNGVSPIVVLPQVQAAQSSTDNTQSYYDYCLGVIAPHIGQNTAVGECGALALAKTSPLIWTLFQLLADAGAIFTLVIYIQKKWIDAGAAG